MNCSAKMYFFPSFRSLCSGLKWVVVVVALGSFNQNFCAFMASAMMLLKTFIRFRRIKNVYSTHLPNLTHKSFSHVFACRTVGSYLNSNRFTVEKCLINSVVYIYWLNKFLDLKIQYEKTQHVYSCLFKNS